MTTVTCEPFRAEHGVELGGDEPRAAEYEAAGRAFSMRQDGRLVACAGLARCGDRIYLWSRTAEDLPLVHVHKAAQRLLRMFRDHRIYAFTLQGNEAGCRWLELLGFEWVDGVGHHHLYMREAA